MSLETLGWNTAFARAFQELDHDGLVPARVLREERERYVVRGATGERQAELAGRLRHTVTRRADLPAVGDWVAVRVSDAGTGSVAGVVSVLPRATAFVRRAAGDADEEQVVAANADTVFLLAGLDGDFNPRRLERYAAAAWDSGAAPVVLLTKADLVDDPSDAIAEAEAAAPGVPVFAISSVAGTGLADLAPWLGAGRTVALLGSSGAGKSTLVNALLGEDRQATAAVRESDARGRHTTTGRVMLQTAGGTWLMDTPGMRELGLWTDAAAIDEAFPDLEAWAADCRFRDCAHGSEPGCAVRAAIERGDLDPERLESWGKLRREAERLAARTDPRLAAERRSRWKAIQSSLKHHPKMGPDGKWRGR